MKRLTKEYLQELVNLSSIKTGYVYTLTGEEKSMSKIKVFCPIHNHTQEQSLTYVKQCRKIKCCNKFAPMIPSDFETIISKFIDKEKISLIDGIFDGYKTKVLVNCPIHGSRTIKLTSLMAKSTEFCCNRCSHKKYNRNFAYSKEKWIEEAKKVHGNTYKYDNMEDDGLHRTITCKKHGDFKQNIHNHVYLANGCRKCVVSPNVSQAEHDLNDLFKTLSFVENVDYTRNDRSILPNYELDFYFPKIKLGIEYNGDYWHSDVNKNSDYHQNKKLVGYNMGINVVMLYEHQYKHKHHIILNRLKSLLHKDKRIYARDTEIKEVSLIDSDIFCKMHHLQGASVSSKRYGLYNGSELVALMTFGKSRFTDHEWELIRYVSTCTIVGGASKLFKHFAKVNNPKNILSYADFDWSIGNLYEKLGMNKINLTKPSYVWIKWDEVLSRYQTQIPNEDKVMKEKGYLKIFKCGSLKFEKTF